MSDSRIGVTVEQLRIGMERFAASMRSAADDILAAHANPDSPEAREVRSKRAYRRRIEDERRAGRAYVARIARDARRDLGLPDQVRR